MGTRVLTSVACPKWPDSDGYLPSLSASDSFRVGPQAPEDMIRLERLGVGFDDAVEGFDAPVNKENILR